MSCKADKRECMHCLHFQNSPEYLEDLYKGLTSLSSAHGSVRCEDGICDLNDQYLASTRQCERFERR